jgi:hypothetical protein
MATMRLASRSAPPKQRRGLAFQACRGGVSFFQVVIASAVLCLPLPTALLACGKRARANLVVMATEKAKRLLMHTMRSSALRNPPPAAEEAAAEREASPNAQPQNEVAEVIVARPS